MSTKQEELKEAIYSDNKQVFFRDKNISRIKEAIRADDVNSFLLLTKGEDLNTLNLGEHREEVIFTIVITYENLNPIYYAALFGAKKVFKHLLSKENVKLNIPVQRTGEKEEQVSLNSDQLIGASIKALLHLVKLEKYIQTRFSSHNNGQDKAKLEIEEDLGMMKFKMNCICRKFCARTVSEYLQQIITTQKGFKIDYPQTIVDYVKNNEEEILKVEKKLFSLS